VTSREHVAYCAAYRTADVICNAVRFVHIIREGVYGVVGYTAVFCIAEAVGTCAYWQHRSTAYTAVAHTDTTESTQQHIEKALTLPVWQLAAATTVLGVTALATEHLLATQPSRCVTLCVRTRVTTY
jgi:hypothetical protein